MPRCAALVAIMQFCLISSLQAQPASETPEAVVRQLYPATVTGVDPDTKLVNEVSPCLACFAMEMTDRDQEGLSRIFTDPLAAFLKRWALEEGVRVLECVDFDPLVDGQDHAISNFSLKLQSQQKDSATVLVEFRNFDTPVQLRFNLVKRQGLWLIDDIVAPDYSLRELVRPCARPGQTP